MLYHQWRTIKQKIKFSFSLHTQLTFSHEKKTKIGLLWRIHVELGDLTALNIIYIHIYFCGGRGVQTNHNMLLECILGSNTVSKARWPSCVNTWKCLGLLCLSFLCFSFRRPFGRACSKLCYTWGSKVTAQKQYQDIAQVKKWWQRRSECGSAFRRI